MESENIALIRISEVQVETQQSNAYMNGKHRQAGLERNNK